MFDLVTILTIFAPALIAVLVCRIVLRRMDRASQPHPHRHPHYRRITVALDSQPEAAESVPGRRAA